ncbi:hypothetical protein SNOG_08640 [Parastagonospora nodorum SN15]|uniref:Uncharacterized protein n=1 Tax=Phaeosphaeria nodorum (strain SN15 / ATCC MYA-4574 / FGSC 10173) TaxID=321614 RepID=Q0UHX4_PHANO|nr:hypothetical protein SNOG_08640 [Parastagonospora nodorum SN15]EAT83808.1 hypothetical protein SNOG_08640 [Parastagonospora nodorum SN15]
MFVPQSVGAQYALVRNDSLGQASDIAWYQWTMRLALRSPNDLIAVQGVLALGLFHDDRDRATEESAL